MQELLTVTEVADVLKVTKYTIREYIKAGKIKASKIGGKEYRIAKGDLEKFISDLEYTPHIN